MSSARLKVNFLESCEELVSDLCCLSYSFVKHGIKSITKTLLIHAGTGKNCPGHCILGISVRERL